MKRLLLFFLIGFCAMIICCFAQKEDSKKNIRINNQTLSKVDIEKSINEKLLTEELCILKNAYPDVSFYSSYNEEKKDFEITINCEDRTSILYWANGRFVSEEELCNKEGFTNLIYAFEEEPLDPKNFSSEDINDIASFSAPENRQKGPVTGTAFFKAIYECTDQTSLEDHIIRPVFLGKKVKIHERIKEPLMRVENKIKELEKTDEETRLFLEELDIIDGYFWRKIRDSNGMSFHSMGLAIDFLPKKQSEKIIYWNWEKIKGKNWITIPLEERWMPSKAVIKAFEEEGFVWGGKWAIWDNMHFEYRPELIEARKYKRFHEL